MPVVSDSLQKYRGKVTPEVQHTILQYFISPFYAVYYQVRLGE